MIVICPSRGRPGNAAELTEAFLATRTLPTTRLLIVVDEDDASVYSGDVLRVPPSHGFVRAANAAFNAFPDEDWYGVLGDDHRFRTPGWDQRVKDTGGIVYGDDLYQGARLPTACFIEGRIVRALGWLALPDCEHLYVDNAWLALGIRLGVMHYLPEIVIEHMHPAAGKAEWDASYLEHNSTEADARDRGAYERWAAAQFEVDAERVRACL
jgi:hypothetical protein